MTNTNYKELAMRTLKPGFDVEIHAALGLGGEIGEMMTAIVKDDTVNLIEELGDLCWYLAIITDYWPVTHDPNIRQMVPSQLRGDDSIKILCSDVGHIIDAIKRMKVYGKDTIDYQSNICMAVATINHIANQVGYTMAQVLDSNIDKLRKRYPEKYTDALALERRDK